MVTEDQKTEVGLLPADWNVCLLGEISTPKARIGWQNLRKDEYMDSGIYMLITGIDFVDGRVKFSTCKYVSKERYDQDTNIQVKNGDILITKDGTLGKVAIVSGLTTPATLNAGVFVLNNLAASVNNEFLYHYLSTNRLMKYAERTSTGGTIQHLNQSVLISFPVAIPPLEEQVRIAEALTNIDDLIIREKELVSKCQSIKKGCLQHMFPRKGQLEPDMRIPEFTGPWKQCKLGDFGTVAMCKRIFKDQTSDSGDVPFYKIGTFGGEPDAFISRDLFEEYKQMYPYPTKGDILVSASGSIGRTVEYSGEDAYYQDSNIVWLKHDRSIINSFLKHLYEVIQWYGIEGSTIKRLYNDNILKTDVMVPSVSEQEAIGRFLDNLDDLIVLHQQEREKYEMIKQGMMEDLLTGKVRLK